MLSKQNEILAGATVTIVHEPTQNRYTSSTRNDGYFHFFNLKPGGPYSIVISYIGFEPLKETNFYSILNGDHFFAASNSESVDFILQKKNNPLEEIIINDNFTRNKYGTQTNITHRTLQSLPTINRNLQDFVRMIPQAKVTGEGVMSLAGQNNRFNAFFY